MNKDSVSAYYDASSSNYELGYDRNLINDISIVYPADYFRLQLLLNSFVENGIKSVIEVGVGEGTPLLTLAKAGMEIAGFDISKEMVEKSKRTLDAHSISSEKIIWGDVRDSITLSPLLADGQYDGLVAMGVMPHVENDIQVLRNMRSMVKPGGKVFIEFRNKLFSLFSFNRLTYEFIMDDLLSDVSDEMKNVVSIELKKKLEMLLPQARLQHFNDESAPGYEAILSKFHNPFEVKSMFEAEGFGEVNLLWYHYHPAPPYLESINSQLYRDESVKLEHESSGWKGLFLCSAFVIEATKM